MITYRIATTEDSLSVTELLYKIDKSFPIPLSEKSDLRVLAEKYLEKGMVWLACDEELLVGMIGFYANDRVTQKAYISVVGVLESHQGHGIAKELMKKCLITCKKQGMKECILYTHKTNDCAIAMYNKLGFIREKDPSRPEDIKYRREL